MEWFEALSRSIHVIAAVCWIGGLYLMIRAVRPILLKNDPGEKNYPLLREIQKKFLLLAGMMLLTILATGVLNIIMVIQNFGGSHPPIKWMLLFTLKLLFAGGLFIIYFMNYLYSRKPSGIPAMIMPNFALLLGFIIIFLGVILHTRLAY